MAVLPADAAAQQGPGPLPDELSGYAHLLELVERGESVREGTSRLMSAAVKIWARPGFETFLGLDRLRFAPFDYQLRAAEAVLRRMRGRAILADEVGLGKTIEAGLVLNELRLRGLARNVMVLCPGA